MQIENTSKLIKRPIRLHSLEEALDELEKLQAANSILVSQKSWELPHVFDHCARSIQGSMMGFPELKSPLFRATIGQIAFHIFDWTGKVRHNKLEEIPGSEFNEGITLEQSIEKLYQTIKTFNDFSKKLHPHFVYGNLSKEKVGRANAMHIADHLSLVEY